MLVDMRKIIIIDAIRNYSSTKKHKYFRSTGIFFCANLYCVSKTTD